MEACIRIIKSNSVATITIHNPGQLNALTLDMRDSLLEHLKECEKSLDIKVIILQGEGGHFCSGSSVGGMGKRTVLETFEHMTKMNELIVTIHNMDKIVIAVVEGYAVGAGFSLALASDLIYTSPEAKFGLAFNKIGLVPDCGLSYFLPRLVGPYKAKEWILSGAIISAEEAQAKGIVNDCLLKEDLFHIVKEKAEMIASGPLYANKMTKSILNKSDQMTLEEVLAEERYAQTILQQTEDHQAGITAFRTKKKPVFTGQ